MQDDTSSLDTLEKFEREWRTCPPGDLDAYLPPPGHASRREMLIDLISVDLEYRWKVGLDRLTEVYLERYPDLADDDEALVRLLSWEFELRRRKEDHLDAAEYVARFPRLADLLRDKIASLTATLNEPFIRSQNEPIHHSPPNLPGYEILEEIGRGGMGVVYKARQIGLDRIVALKVIRADLAVHPGVRQRFSLEAKAIARLDHPGIVRIHDSGIHEGQPYFVMEFVSGGCLTELLRRGPLSPQRSAELLIQVAEAVQHAHEAGIIHRDLKPGNVLLVAPETTPIHAPKTRDSGKLRPKVTDFGLARFLGVGANTQAGEFLGTFAYAAPEQLGPDQNLLDTRADVFGLGAILYECLTGHPPFQVSGQPRLDRSSARGEITPPRVHNPSIPLSIQQTCLRAMHRDPSRRHPSAQAFADELRRFLHRRRWLAPAWMAAMILVAASLAIWWRSLLSPAPNATAPSLIETFSIWVTNENKRDWKDLLNAQESFSAIPVRNGALLSISVTLDHPGYVYLIYLDGETGDRVPLSPWNDPQSTNEKIKITITDLSHPPPLKKPTRVVHSPIANQPGAEQTFGWPVVGESSMDGVLALSRSTPLPNSVNLGQIVTSIKVPFTDNRSSLFSRIYPEQRHLVFNERGGQRTDLAGTFGDLRGIGRVAERSKDPFVDYLARLISSEQFDSVGLCFFPHEGN